MDRFDMKAGSTPLCSLAHSFTFAAESCLLDPSTAVTHVLRTLHGHALVARDETSLKTSVKGCSYTRLLGD